MNKNQLLFSLFAVIFQLLPWKVNSCSPPNLSNIDIRTEISPLQGVQIVVEISDTWLSPGNRDYVQVRYKKEGGNWIEFPSQSIPPQTYYKYDFNIEHEVGMYKIEVQARYQCNLSWSDWSKSKTTTIKCWDNGYNEITKYIINKNSVEIKLLEFTDQVTMEASISSDGGRTFSTYRGMTPNIIIQNLTPSTPYYIKWRLLCANGSFSQYSSLVNFITDCNNPSSSDLLCITKSNTSIQATCLEEAFKYQFRIKPKNESTWITSSEKSTDNHTFTGLMKGETYDIQVRTYCSWGKLTLPAETHTEWSSWSSSKEHMIEIDCPKPLKSEIEIKNITDNSVTFKCNSGHGGGDINSHSFRYKKMNASNWTRVDGEDGNLNVNELEENTDYVMQSLHNCEQGEQSDWSDEKSFTTLVKDCNVSEGAIKILSIDYTSAEFKCEQNNRSGYLWRYRKTGNTGWNTSQEVQENRLMVAGLTKGEEYEVQLKVNCDPNYSDWTASVFFNTLDCPEPIADRILMGNIEHNSASLQYADLPGINPDVYEWKYTNIETSTFHKVQSNEPFMDITNLVTGAEYKIELRFKCGDVWSAWVEGTQILLTDCATRINRFSAITTNSLIVVTSDNGGHGSELQYRKVATSEPWYTQQSTNIEINVSNLVPDTEYEFQIRGDRSCDGPSWSESSYAVTKALPTCDPPRRATLTATNIDHQSASLNCAEGGADTYQFRYAKYGDPNWTTPTGSSNSSQTVSGLSERTRYNFQCRIMCGTQLSDWSDTARFLTTTEILGLKGGCYAPEIHNLLPTEIGSNSAILNCVNCDFERYQFRYKDSSSSDWIELAEQTSASMELSQLKEFSLYEFQCRGFCNQNLGTYSSSRYFITGEATTCLAPFRLHFNATKIRSKEAVLSCLNQARLYLFRYRSNTDELWTISDTSGNPNLNLIDLQANTLYYYQVRLFCDNRMASDWSPLKSFTTLDICEVIPSNSIRVETITDSKATVIIKLNSSELIRFRYKSLSDNTWTYSTFFQDSAIDIKNLSPKTEYEIQIFRLCNEFESSGWSSSIKFKTQESVNTKNLNSKPIYKIYPNPASQILNIESNNNESYHYQIYNSIGQLMNKDHISNNKKQITLDLWPNGVYFIELIDGIGNKFTSKLIKQ